MVSVTVFQIFKNKRLFIHAGLRRLFKSTYLFSASPAQTMSALFSSPSAAMPPNWTKRK
jgi:hypothetical protein